MPISKIKISSITADASSVNLNIDANTLFLDAANNRVGVGTTSPTAALDVYSSSGNALQLYQNDGTYNRRLVTTITSTGANLGVTLNATSSVGNDNLIFQVSSAEQMRLTAAGNLGIGTKTPVAKLDIAGAMRAYSRIPFGGPLNTGSATANWFYIGNINLDDSHPALLRIDGTQSYSQGAPIGGCTYVHLRGNNGDTLEGYFYGTTQGSTTILGVAYKSTAANYFDIWIKLGDYASGLVYCDTSGVYTPASTDTGSTTQPSGSTALGSLWSVTTGGLERARIDSAGNLGIGTNTPVSLLTVQGSVTAASGTLTAATLRNNSDGGVGINFVNAVTTNANPLASINALITSTGAGTDDGVLSFSTAFNGATSERMRINNIGAITTPYQPAFSAYPSTTATVNANTDLPFNSVETNSNRGGCFNTTTYRFTAPVTGMYWFNLMLTKSLSTETIAYTALMVNGGRTRDLFEENAWTNGNQEWHSSAMIYLFANDYVTIRSGRSIILEGGNANYYSLFQGYLIG